LGCREWWHGRPSFRKLKVSSCSSCTISCVHAVLFQNLSIVAQTVWKWRSFKVRYPPALESQINLRIYPRYIWDIFWDIFRKYPRFIWDIDESGIYPGYIRDISQMNPGYIPDLSNIPNLSRIYPGFIPDDR
jgi:hypothetical protein